MAAVINPPNTPIIDGSGRVTPEWYRFFASLNREVQSNTTVVIDQTIFGDGTTPIIADETSAVVDEAFSLAPSPQWLDIDDYLPPVPIEPDPVDLSPYALIGSSSYLNVRTVTATASPAASDYLLLVDATAGAVTINLPAAASNAKRVLIIKKTDGSANAVTLDGNAAETIDGSATKVISTQYQSFTIQCDGSAWWIT